MKLLLVSMLMIISFDVKSEITLSEILNCGDPYIKKLELCDTSTQRSADLCTVRILLNIADACDVRAYIEQEELKGDKI